MLSLDEVGGISKYRKKVGGSVGEGTLGSSHIEVGVEKSVLTQVGEGLDCNSEYNFSPGSNGEALTKCTGSIIPICINGSLGILEFVC